MPHVTKKIKRLAAKEGISMNAFVVPFLNDIADELLVRRATYESPQRGQQPK